MWKTVKENVTGRLVLQGEVHIYIMQIFFVAKSTILVLNKIHLR
jgi:hypothetical protein